MKVQNLEKWSLRKYGIDVYILITTERIIVHLINHYINTLKQANDHSSHRDNTIKSSWESLEHVVLEIIPLNQV